MNPTTPTTPMTSGLDSISQGFAMMHPNYSTLSSNNGNQYGGYLDGQIGNYYSPNISMGPGGPALQYTGGMPDYNQGQTGGSQGLGGTLTGTMGGSQGGGGTQTVTGNQPVVQGGPQQNLQQIPEYAPTPEGQAYLNSLGNYQNQITGLMSMVDQNYNAELAQINAQFGMLKNQQQRENELYGRGVRQAGLASGMAEITPEIMKGQLHQIVSDGIQKITALTIQQNGLVLDARKANISQKLDIYEKLQAISKEKYETARQMKIDFFDNIKREDEMVASKVNQVLPGIYSELQSLPASERQERLKAYADQLGIPAARFAGLYEQYNKQEQQPIMDYKMKLMEMAPDINWSFADTQMPLEQFMQKLKSSPYFKAQLYSQTLDNAYKQAQINKLNSESAPGMPMTMSGLNYGKNVTFIANPNLTADQQKILDAVNNTGEIVRQAQELYGKAFTSRPETQTGGTISGLTQSRFFDQYYKEYYDHVRGIASILAKVYGNTGNPSDRDIKNAIGIFPDKYDTEASAKKKWENLYSTALNRLSNLGTVYVVQ